jgi:hypothetical protein
MVCFGAFVCLYFPTLFGVASLFQSLESYEYYGNNVIWLIGRWDEEDAFSFCSTCCSTER